MQITFTLDDGTEFVGTISKRDFVRATDEEIADTFDAIIAEAFAEAEDEDWMGFWESVAYYAGVAWEWTVEVAAAFWAWFWGEFGDVITDCWNDLKAYVREHRGEAMEVAFKIGAGLVQAKVGKMPMPLSMAA